MRRLILFLFRTAYAGHYARPDDLADALDAADLLEWRAEFELEPWGEARGDIATAIGAAAVINNDPWRPRGTRPVQPKDLLPKYGEASRRPRGPSSIEDQQAYLLGLTLAMGGEVKPSAYETKGASDGGR